MNNKGSNRSLSKIIQNAGWIIFERILQMIISLAVSLMTARFLGPANYGLINYAAAYTGFFSAICTLGINSIIVKEFVDNPGKEGEILGSSFLLRAISSLLSTIVIMCIVLVVDRNDPVVFAVVFLKCIGMIFQMAELFNYWFHSQLQSQKAAKVTFYAYLITAIYKVIILVQEKSIVWFALTSAIDYGGLAFFLFYAYRKSTNSHLSISLQRCTDILKKSYHFILPRLMIAVYAQTDKIMLRQMLGDAETGYYSTAISICTTWYFVLSAIIDSMNPAIMEAYKKNQQLFVCRNKQLYCAIFYISVFVAITISTLSDYIVLLLFGSAYSRAAMPLRIVTWNAAFSYLGTARNAWIVCMERQKYLKYVYSIAAISNVILNLLLIPVCGAVGAATASLIAQVIITIIVPFFISDLRENTIMMIQAIMLKGIRYRTKVKIM